MGGVWDSVALMVTGRDATGDELDKVRLLWRDWKPGMHPGNDKEAAAKFVAVLAERYISPRNRTNFAGDFLDGDSGEFRSGDFQVSLNAKDQGSYVLHRIELKNLAKRGTAMAPTWVPPSPPKGDYIAPVPVAPQPAVKIATPDGWVNPNVPPPQPIAAPVPEPQPHEEMAPAEQPVPTPPVQMVPMEEVMRKPTPPLLPPKHEILPPQPQPEVMKVPVPVVPQSEVPAVLPQQPKPEPVPAPVEALQPQPAPVVETPVSPQPVAPIQPPMERQPVSPAEMIPNLPMDEEENYIFKEFDGEVTNDL